MIVVGSTLLNLAIGREKSTSAFTDVQYSIIGLWILNLYFSPSREMWMGWGHNTM